MNSIRMRIEWRGPLVQLLASLGRRRQPTCWIRRTRKRIRYSIHNEPVLWLHSAWICTYPCHIQGASGGIRDSYSLGCVTEIRVVSQVGVFPLGHHQRWWWPSGEYALLGYNNTWIRIQHVGSSVRRKSQQRERPAGMKNRTYIKGALCA